MGERTESNHTRAVRRERKGKDKKRNGPRQRTGVIFIMSH